MNRPYVNNPCIICGSSSFIWGKPVAGGGVWFDPNPGSWHMSNVLMGFHGKDGFIARACNTCGNVQFFLRDLPLQSGIETNETSSNRGKPTENDPLADLFDK